MDPRLIAALFPAEVVVECGDPAELQGEPHPLELPLFTKVVEKRRRELLAGRLLARRALERLGITDHALLPDEHRAPIWPAGIVGSISHTRSACAVVVARATEVLGLGLDLEDGRGLPERALTLVCTERERTWIATRPQGERRQLGTLFFSAKESVYKCQHPLSRRWLGFRDVELELGAAADSRTLPAEGRFAARPSGAGAPIWPPESRFVGRFLRTDAALVCAATLLASESRASA